MMPDEHEREWARSTAFRLAEETRTLGELASLGWLHEDYRTFLDAARCVDIAIRIGDALNAMWGAIPIDRSLCTPLATETPLAWIERVSAVVFGDVTSEVQESEKQHDGRLAG